MLEIFLVYALCKKLGEKVRAKGRTAWPFQLMLVLFWFGGEFMAGFIAAIVNALQSHGAPPEFGFSIYLIALAGAGCGAGMVYAIVAMLPGVQPVWSPQQSYGGPAPQFPPPDPNNPYAAPRSPLQ